MAFWCMLFMRVLIFDFGMFRLVSVLKGDSLRSSMEVKFIGQLGL